MPDFLSIEVLRGSGLIEKVGLLDLKDRTEGVRAWACTVDAAAYVIINDDEGVVVQVAIGAVSCGSVFLLECVGLSIYLSIHIENRRG